MTFNIKPLIIGGKEFYPIIEGGKGIGISNGETAGAFANSGAIGTFSGVNAASYDENGNQIEIIYHSKDRISRHEELVAYAIKGAIAQAKIAYETSNSKGRIHMNVLWEMGGAERVLRGVLDETKGLINGITCGAGMPYKLSEIATEYNIYYFPIVSSMRAFRALWKRSYYKNKELLGGVVYEDPWLAGGHNGLSNSENPQKPEDPYLRIVELRNFLNEVGLKHVPIIMAGGVWYLRDFASWLDNDEIGNIGFQFGTRPLLTKESPIPYEWKQRLLSLKEGDVFLNRFSPTGFYSSAVKNSFIEELDQRNKRQIEYSVTPKLDLNHELSIGERGRSVYIKPEDAEKVERWISQGFETTIRTPDSTIIFVTKDKSQEIRKDQISCMGCLSACKFSNWSEHSQTHDIGKKPDPRSFCIQKTLQNAIKGFDLENQLIFSGHNAYKFSDDPFYKNGFIPTVKELVERILEGN